MKLIHTEEHKSIEYFFSFGGIAYQGFYFGKVKRNRKREIVSVTVKNISDNQEYSFDYDEIVNAVGGFDYESGLTLEECQILKIKALRNLLEQEVYF